MDKYRPPYIVLFKYENTIFPAQSAERLLDVRACQGYGPRLVWRPESTIEPRHIRSQLPPFSASSTQVPQGHETRFLIYDSKDMDLAAGRLNWHKALAGALAGPRCTPMLHRPSTDQESAIFSYCLY
uniref:Uncharacterized protein n=1 Tax=Fusarium oxysporum (strain Fo5176) TaxID=660025 RepID=A0A0D2Y1I8_FUSOF